MFFLVLFKEKSSHYDLGRFDEAKEQLLHAISLKPSDLSAHFNLGNSERSYICFWSGSQKITPFCDRTFWNLSQNVKDCYVFCERLLFVL